MPHNFSRSELLIGKEALEKLGQSKVAVFGIGGVGSFVVEGLARTGIGNLVLVDHDIVCQSNINRQLHATHKTLGRPKVEVMKERILDINPRAEVIIHQAFYTTELAGQLISRDYDYIIDAIDTVSSKIDLIVRAKGQGIPIISCMGAGNKLDPQRFEITDIYSTSVCPLAKVMRRELRKKGIDRLKVVYSREEPLKPGINLQDDNANKENHNCSAETGKSPGNRRSTPGSIAFVPSVAGMILAGEVVKDLIGYSLK